MAEEKQGQRSWAFGMGRTKFKGEKNMDQKDKELERTLIEAQSKAEGIHRRTFLKELLAAGAVTSLGGWGLMDLSRAEAVGEAGPARKGNLYQKIIGAHLGSGEMKPGAEISLLVDSTLTQDGLGVMAYLQYEAIGIPAVRTKLSVSYVDHQTLQDGFENADDHRYLETVTDQYGVLYSRAGNGICHQVHLERFSQSRLDPGRRRQPYPHLRRRGHGGRRRRRARPGRGHGRRPILPYLPQGHAHQPERQTEALGFGQGYRP